MPMTKAKLEELQKDGFALSAKARDIVTRYGDDSSKWPTEIKAEFEDALTKGREKLEEIRAAKHDLSVLDFARDLAAEVGGRSGGPTKAVNDIGVGRDQGQRIDLKSFARAGGAKMADLQVKAGRTDGQKALAANLATIVGQSFQPNPIALGQIANSLLDIIPIFTTSPEFSYLVQTARTNNAAVVADGAEKPESTYGLDRKEASLAVVAHMSEPISKYWLADNSAVEEFIQSELEYGLGRAIEAIVLAAINATSGIQLQAYSTSVLQTIRKAMTKLQAVGLIPGGIVVTPTVWEGIELALSSTSAIDYQGLPYDAAARRLWGVPVVVNLTAADGFAHVIANDSLGLATDGQTELKWTDQHEDDFSHNFLRARCETRVKTVAFRPLGIVKAALSA